MNNAQKFVFDQIRGLSITFKPIEKGKDRPVQTMRFAELTPGKFGLEVETTITYITKNSSTPTTAFRMLSLARVMEYIAQAAEQTYSDAATLPTAPPQNIEPQVEQAPEEVPVVDDAILESVDSPLGPITFSKKSKKAKATAEV